MKTKIKITMEQSDGKAEQIYFVADARDIRRYEAEFESSFLTTDLSMTQVTQLAYVTMKRKGMFSGSYEQFDAQCSEVESDDAEDEVLPTLQAPGEELSSV